MDPRGRKKMGKRYFLFLYVLRVLCVYVRRKENGGEEILMPMTQITTPEVHLSLSLSLSFPDDGGEKRKEKKKDAAILPELMRENVGRVSLDFCVSVVLILSRGREREKQTSFRG